MFIIVVVYFAYIDRLLVLSGIENRRLITAVFGSYEQHGWRHSGRSGLAEHALFATTAPLFRLWEGVAL